MKTSERLKSTDTFSPKIEESATYIPISVADDADPPIIYINEISGDGVALWGRIIGDILNQQDLIDTINSIGLYSGGNGILINNKVISLDDLILDCGTSTQVV